MNLRSSNSTSIIEAPSKRILHSTTLSLVGISSPWTAACAVTAGLPSAAGTFLSRVCEPFSAPFSKTKVCTTLCQTLAGSALLKVVGEQQLLLLGDRVGRDGGQVGGEGGRR